MKIDNNCHNLDTTPAGKVDAARTADAKAAKAGTAAAGSDQFSVSADAKLASSAIDAVSKAPDIRPEAVARGKALLAEGKLGNDPDRLADALIDSLIKNQ
jgi:flagellar biosynthesis anti-sigma factor FlgM